MQQPDLSVLIPTYGRTATIARLLDRLRDQTLEPGRFEDQIIYNIPQWKLFYANKRLTITWIFLQTLLMLVTKIFLFA